MRKLSILTSLFLTLVFAGCASKGGSPSAKRTNINNERQEILNKLYQTEPGTRKQIATSPGYGVFSNLNVNLIFASFGGGYGVVRDNMTGKDTYMRVGEAGLGLGAGAKDYRLIFVFHNEWALHRFIEKGWNFGAQADAAAKSNEKGGEVGAESSLFDNITVYEITETGLALQATVKGMKFWKDGSLN